MKKFLSRLATASLLTALPCAALATDAAESSLHANSIPQAVALTVAFALLGILLAIVGYRLFDRFTPGDLHREIIENKNIAAAIIGGSVILGVSIIVAAAILG